MSKGVPPSFSADSGSGAKAKLGLGSTKRRMSQAQAVRSMCGWGLVTQSMGPSFLEGGGRLESPVEISGRFPYRLLGCRSPQGTEIIALVLKEERPLEAEQLSPDLLYWSTVLRRRLATRRSFRTESAREA